MTESTRLHLEVEVQSLREEIQNTREMLLEIATLLDKWNVQPEGGSRPHPHLGLVSGAIRTAVSRRTNATTSHHCYATDPWWEGPRPEAATWRGE
jgi:hypothetical protein